MSDFSSLFDTSTAFTGGYGDFSKLLGGKSPGTASTGMDPFTAILGVGSLGASLFGGLGSQRAAASSLQAQFDAQKAGTEAGARIAREGLYAQLGSDIASRLGAERAAKLGFELQKKGREWELGPGAQKQIAIASELSERQRRAAISPEAQKARMFENLLAMKAQQAAAEGPMAAMFGPKAPTRVSSMVV